MARRSTTVLAPQVLNYLTSPAELRAGMVELFALYRSGAFEKISTTKYALRDAAELHGKVERRAVSGISVLVP